MAMEITKKNRDDDSDGGGRDLFIVPVAFSGNDRMWPIGDWMFDFARGYASVGDPIDVAAHGTSQALMVAVQAAITDLRETHPDRRRKK